MLKSNKVSMNRIITALVVILFIILISGFLLFAKSEYLNSTDEVNSNDEFITRNLEITDKNNSAAIATSNNKLPYLKIYTPEPPTLHTFFEVTKGCKVMIDENCTHAYASTTTTSPIKANLRIGVILLVNNKVTTSDGTIWYEVNFAEPIRYQKRVSLPWFVTAKAGNIFSDIGLLTMGTSTTINTKQIIVDRSEQMLYAFIDDKLFMKSPVSTGLLLSPTPRGTFTIFKKTPTRYMQGPLPGISNQYFDLPGVPWNLYFTEQGAVIHGAYWHNSFGKIWSHGCVNLPPEIAKKLYIFADLGTTVIIRD